MTSRDLKDAHAGSRSIDDTKSELLFAPLISWRPASDVSYAIRYNSVIVFQIMLINDGQELYRLRNAH